MIPVKMLVYGQPGVGKTVFVSTASEDPRTSPLLFLDFESGTMSISSKVTEYTVDDLYDGKAEKEGAKMPSIHIKKWKDFDDVLDYLEGPASGWIKSVALDTLTEINYMNLRDAVQHDPKRALGPDEPAELQHYMRSATQMRRMIRRFRDLNTHLFLSAHAQDNKDDSSGILTISPAMVGKLTYEIAALVDIVAYMRVNSQKDREMLFQPSGRVTAKDRSEGGKLGSSQIDLTVTELLDIIYGKDE